MTKKYITILGLTGLVLLATPALAKQTRVAMDLVTPGTEKTLTLPTPAENSNVISLGTALDPGTGKIVEGYAIVRYAKGGIKGKPTGKNDSQCYTFLAKDAKWKTVEDYMVDTTNSGLDDSFVRGNIALDIDKWETASGADILGGEVVGLVDGADGTSPDNKNEIVFGPLDNGTIGVTIIWGIFGGKPSNRELVEWDQVYNTGYEWSETGEAGKMDFESIATHELGHSVGMGDLYDIGCIEETMYGYADNGETNKRDLNAGDIAGITELYK